MPECYPASIACEQNSVSVFGGREGIWTWALSQEAESPQWSAVWVATRTGHWNLRWMNVLEGPIGREGVESLWEPWTLEQSVYAIKAEQGVMEWWLSASGLASNCTCSAFPGLWDWGICSHWGLEGFWNVTDIGWWVLKSGLICSEGMSIVE